MHVALAILRTALVFGAAGAFVDVCTKMRLGAPIIAVFFVVLALTAESSAIQTRLSSASGPDDAARIGRELSVSTHLRDGQEFSASLGSESIFYTIRMVRA